MDWERGTGWAGRQRMGGRRNWGLYTRPVPGGAPAGLEPEQAAELQLELEQSAGLEPEQPAGLEPEPPPRLALELQQQAGLEAEL